MIADDDIMDEILDDEVRGHFKHEILTIDSGEIQVIKNAQGVRKLMPPRWPYSTQRVHKGVFSVFFLFSVFFVFSVFFIFSVLFIKVRFTNLDRKQFVLLKFSIF